jgi:Ca2+-binding RTX toxin-like protein
VTPKVSGFALISRATACGKSLRSMFGASRGGSDSLQGYDGRDELRGGPGDDRLRGGSDDDSLDGGLGKNTNQGGPGVDSCINPAPGDAGAFSCEA